MRRINNRLHGPQSRCVHQSSTDFMLMASYRRAPRAHETDAAPRKTAIPPAHRMTARRLCDAVITRRVPTHPIRQSRRTTSASVGPQPFLEQVLFQEPNANGP
jgi:hypothetical protein